MPKDNTKKYIASVMLFLGLLALGSFIESLNVVDLVYSVIMFVYVIKVFKMKKI